MVIGWILYSTGIVLAMLVPAKPLSPSDVLRYFARCTFPFFAGSFFIKKKYNIGFSLAFIGAIVYSSITIGFGPMHVVEALLAGAFGALIGGAGLREEHSLNWFGPSPPGTWTETTLGRVSELVTYMRIATITLFVWIAANVPELAFAGVFYSIFMVFNALGWVAETVRPHWRWIAFIDMGAPEKWKEGALLGLLLGLSMLALGTVLPGQLVRVEPFLTINPVLTFLVVALAIPIAEEGMFGGVLTPTLVEDVGIIPGLVLIGPLFAVFHLAAYGAALGALVFAGVFRILASSLILYQRSLVGAVVAHATINAFTLLTILLA